MLYIFLTKFNLPHIYFKYIFIMYLCGLIIILSNKIEYSALSALLVFAGYYLIMSNITHVESYEITAATHYYYMFILMAIVFSLFEFSENEISKLFVLLSCVIAVDCIIEKKFHFKMLHSLIEMKPVFSPKFSAVTSIQFNENFSALICFIPVVYILWSYRGKLKIFLISIIFTSLIILDCKAVLFYFFILLIIYLYRSHYRKIAVISSVILLFAILSQHWYVVKSFGIRMIYWNLALKLFLRESILFGSGTGNFPSVFFIFKGSYPSGGHITPSPHNILLQILCENGLIGVCIFIILSLLLFIKARQKKMFFLFSFVVIILLHNLFDMSSLDRMVFFTAALVCGAILREIDIQKKDESYKRKKQILRGFVLVFAFFCLLSSFFIGASEYFQKKASKSLFAGNYNDFETKLASAFHFYPLHPSNFLLRGQYIFNRFEDSKNAEFQYYIASNFSIDKRLVTKKFLRSN